MTYIVNQTKDIRFPYEPGLLEWLQQHYPYSKYHLEERTEHDD